MSDLNELIKEFLEKKGRFQFMLIVLLCLNSITVGINHTITSFHVYVPKFFCVVSVLTFFSEFSKNTFSKTLVTFFFQIGF